MIFRKLTRRPALGVRSGRLKPLGSRPHGVSSQSPNREFQVEPFYYSGNSQAAWNRLLAIIEKMDRTRLIEREPAYARFECWSPFWGFVDDLELLVDAAGSRIEVRSAARLGYWDLGVNRKRVERIRAIYREEPADCPG